MTKTRTETDTFGPVEVDASRYWGAQAQRSLGNFKIGWEKQPEDAPDPVVAAPEKPPAGEVVSLDSFRKK